MGVTGIFFLAPTTANTDARLSQLIFTRLTALHHLDPINRWTLEHRLYRENVTTSDEHGAVTGARSTSTRYLQILTSSYRPESTYLGITKAQASTTSGLELSDEPATVMSVPAPHGTEDFIQLLKTRLGSLWTLRQFLQVVNGQAYAAGDFIIRFGDVRQIQAGAQQLKGTVIEIEWTGTDGDDWETAKGVIEQFWSDLGIKGAKSIILVPGLRKGFGSARQWFEALRLRS